MISNSDIKAAWVSRVKSRANITALVSAAEIREINWKGEDFIYPNIRIQLAPLSPTNTNSDCRIFQSDVTVFIYTEQKSSKSADDIAGVVAEELWGRGFTVGNVKVNSVHLTSVDPAIVPEEDKESWRSAVNLRTLVQQA